ncbi:MAG: hypothetical protein ACSLE0_06915 [Chitinophagaceae bacterium]
MKAKSTQILIVRIILFILVCLYSFIVFGQPSNGQNSSLQKFSISANGEKAKLQWTLTSGNNLSTVVIEKGISATELNVCAEFWVNFDGNKETNFQFADKKSNESAYYRLKMIDAEGKIQYSNIIHNTGQKDSGN